MIRFVHGFNVPDGGKSSLGPLSAEYSRQLLEPVELFSWGWSGVLSVRFKTGGAIESFIERQRQEPARAWVGHSHGAHIICAALEALPDDVEPPEALILLQPAMHVDYELPYKPILVRYNPGDLAVWWGKQWRRFNPVSWIKRHPWGAAGRYGFKRPHDLVLHVDTSTETHGQAAYRGHGVGDPAYWGEHDADYLKEVLGDN